MNLQKSNIDGKTVGLILIDTSSPVLAQNALRISLEQFKFYSTKVFTDTPDHYPGFECITIPTLKSSSDYSNIVVKVLPEYIDTDFIIIIHYDGFILNGTEFSPTYFHYDYIGAPWISDSEHMVGNGGFSWRSKKICDAIKELCHDGEVIEAEDIFICKTKRKELEKKYNCFFPSGDIALHFSYENSPPRFQTFGFHGAFHLPILYRNTIEWLMEHLPDRLLVESDVTSRVFRHHVSLVSDEATYLYDKQLSLRGKQATKNRVQ
jgi:hypothetical protein